MRDKTSYIRQNKTELKQINGQMTSQRQDFYHSYAIQHEYLDKLGMRHLLDEDSDFYKQEQYRQRKGKPKLEK